MIDTSGSRAVGVFSRRELSSFITGFDVKASVLFGTYLHSLLYSNEKGKIVTSMLQYH